VDGYLPFLIAGSRFKRRNTFFNQDGNRSLQPQAENRAPTQYDNI